MADGGLPTGTLTFLFTDLEGSTHLLQRLGDRYPALLAAHYELMRAAFGRNAGQEVGTRFEAREGRHSSFKLWLRYAKPTREVRSRIQSIAQIDEAHTPA